MRNDQLRPQLTAKKAKFLNMQEDGIKIRSSSFKNKKKYSRKDQTWKKDYEQS